MLIVIVAGVCRPRQPWEYLLPEFGGPVLKCCARGGLRSHHQLHRPSGVTRPGSGLQRAGRTGGALQRDVVQPTCFCGATYQVQQASSVSSFDLGSVIVTPPPMAQTAALPEEGQQV